MKSDKIWTFPEKIDFVFISEYMKRIEGVSFSEKLHFDLSETENVHSSFIGFLIFVKQMVEKNCGVLILEISSSLKKLFVMLNIYEYFAASIPSRSIRKIA